MILESKETKWIDSLAGWNGMIMILHINKLYDKLKI